jgi:polysaccharide export outer membrane protein
MNQKTNAKKRPATKGATAVNDTIASDPRIGWMHRQRTTGRILLLLLAALTILSSCAPVSTPVNEKTDSEPVADYYLKADEINRMNTMILSQAQTVSPPGEYLLGEGDLLQISVFEAEELGTKVRVSSRGFINLPLIETVAVKGLTAIQAEEKIEALYKASYIKNPHVTIFVEEHISQRITLVGQFKIPGTYDYPSKQRLLDVIALGGGLNEKAGQLVQVRRSRSVPGQPDTFMVDLDQLITHGNAQLNIEINGGDVIFIPEAGVFFVDGSVRRPGAYPIKHHTVVQEAIVEAGGFETWAKKDAIKLIRVSENGERKVIDLDLSVPDVREMAINDRDILVVEESGAAGFMKGFSVSFLGTGFSFYGR